MMHKMFKTVSALGVAVFLVGSIAEAAPRKVVHRRAVHHSARVVRHVAKKPSRRVVHATARSAKPVVRHRSTKPR
jgi:hypothetical protein